VKLSRPSVLRGILPSREAVLQLYGPEPMHEASAIAAAIRTLVRRG
jgi:hypothetical protein